MASATQGYGYGNFFDPYSGYGNRYGMAGSPYSPYSSYGGQGYLPQTQAYQAMSYASPVSGYMNRGYAGYGFGPQFAAHPYQTSQIANGQNYNGYQNYNNYNNYNNNGLTQGGISEVRDEKNYASSASTQSETHSSVQSSNESPIFDASRLAKRVSGTRRTVPSDHWKTE